MKKRKPIIIICCIVLCAVVCTGIYMHYNAVNNQNTEKVELGRGGYASNITGRNAPYAMVANIVNAMAAPQAIVNLNYVADVDIIATSTPFKPNY